MFLKRLTVFAVALTACCLQMPAQALPPTSPSLPAPVPHWVSTASGVHTIAPAANLKIKKSPAESVDMLLTLAFSLRDIQYRFGGTSPKSGFDCSGFVRYVFHHALGVMLPRNSRSQYNSGTRIARAKLKPGDLVFFRTHGRHVSHVGIYLDDGRFIHSPSTGETVRVDSLKEQYWARRFVGARRPEGIAHS